MAKNNTSNDLTLENIKNVVREVVHNELVPIDFRLTNLEAEFRIMRTEFKLMRSEFEERFDRMTNGIDKLLGVGKNHAEEHAANQVAHTRFEERIAYA